MVAGRRGVGLTPMETRREVIVEMACAAERLGYEAFILPEAWGFDSTVLLAEIATRTSEIKLVAGILSIWGRTPAQMAMAAATLNDLSDGRFVLGLGASTPNLAEGFHDVGFDRPAARLEETLAAVRALLSGERAVVGEERAARPLRLMIGGSEVPVWLGALGPRTIDLTARLADGWLPACASYDYLSGVRPGLEAVRSGAGVATTPLEIISGPTVSTGDAGTAEATLAFYLCTMGDGYADFVAAQGFGQEVTALRQANPRPSPTECDFPEESRVLLDQLMVSGEPDEVRAGLAKWDEVLDLQFVGFSPGESWEAIENRLEICAPE